VNESLFQPSSGEAKGVSMQHTVAIIIIVVLVLFKIYRHARKEIGFQKFAKRHALTRIAPMVITGVVLLVTGVSNPMRYIFDVIGILLGSIIAFYSIRTSAFEWRNNDWFYRQNRWIGKCIFVLLAGRIAHKGYDDVIALIGSVANEQGTRHIALANYTRDPAVTGIMFILIAYYIVYYALLIRKSSVRSLMNQELRGN
jgi:hypothetical protein